MSLGLGHGGTKVRQTAGTAPLPARLVGISHARDLAVIRVHQRHRRPDARDVGRGLVDLIGHVLGIPTLELADPQLGAAAAGIGFAMPSYTVVAPAGRL